MWALLGPFLVNITGSIVARVLTALGMGFVTYTVLSTLTDNVVSNVDSAYGLVDPVVMALLNLSGMTSALTIITSALVTRASLMVVKKLKFT
ncbi:DUF2523 domain-containing protein [Methylobacter sp. Wu8]|uniref:DUF2523 domain-containing protein n=1 Tax=Methylobacter sp. Wu8 TaxID=3118457 RepID=UPI002F307DF6